MPIKPVLPLSAFIRGHKESILQAWENFARTLTPPAATMDAAALRNHASQMLLAIADDLDQPQTPEEQVRKSEGQGKRGPADTAAETHAIARLLSGFSIDQLASEYRALRSSVLRLWALEWKEGREINADDVTRFNEAIDQALAESLARYTSLFNQSRNLFLAILSHDLRNPLGTTIQGAQLFLLSEDMESRYREIAIRIYNSGLRMNKLVDDLIDYTRTHLGSNLPISPGPVNLIEVTQNVIDEIRIAHQDRKIKFDVEGMPDGVWDGERIAQALSNLLGNAIQYGAPEEIITVTICAADDEITVAINNRGPVIPEEKLQTIFEPLVRLVERGFLTPEKDNSMGLGLYVVREVVKAHGGTIKVSSSLEEGTTFTIRLPRISPAS